MLKKSKLLLVLLAMGSFVNCVAETTNTEEQPQVSYFRKATDFVIKGVCGFVGVAGAAYLANKAVMYSINEPPVALAVVVVGAIFYKLGQELGQDLKECQCKDSQLMAAFFNCVKYSVPLVASGLLIAADVVDSWHILGAKSGHVEY
jgi:SNF family Na+-dependent transporter